MFAVFVAISCAFFVILLPNTVFVLLIAAATSVALATPVVPVTVPFVVFGVNVPSATSIVIV